MKKKQLLIFGQKVPVIYKKNYKEDEGFCGEFDDKTKTITIDSNLSEDVNVITLVHEMGHAMFNRIGLNQAINKDLEEVIVEAFATCLHENFTLRRK